VRETEHDLADCVGAVYERRPTAAPGSTSGSECVACSMPQRATLFFGGGPLVSHNVLMPADGSEIAYAAHFLAIDPYKAQARRDFAEARAHHLGRAKIGPEQDFLRSEYYFDFARHNERRHMIGGMAGIAEANPIGLFRGKAAGPFGERESCSFRPCCRICSAPSNYARSLPATSSPPA